MIRLMSSFFLKPIESRGIAKARNVISKLDLVDWVGNAA